MIGRSASRTMAVTSNTITSATVGPVAQQLSLSGPLANYARRLNTISRNARRGRIFISYRRADSAGHAGRLKDDLTRLLGDRVFMDVADIAPGADFESVLGEELASCGAVLAVIGVRWREAFDVPREGLDFVRLELAEALAHSGVHVVPVLMQGAGLPAACDLPADLKALAGRQATVIRDDRWKDDVAHLANELRRELKLSRLPFGWIAAGVVVLAALALWLFFRAPPTPGAYSRSQAQEVALAATAKAAASCKPPVDLAGECPLVFQFAPDGSTRNVYFDSGSCSLKAPPFGECVLKRLSAVHISPFVDVTEAEVEVNLLVASGGTTKVIVNERVTTE